MKVSSLVCDRCGKTADKNFNLWYDRKADAAGSRENLYYEFDLCSECKSVALRIFFDRMNRETVSPEEFVKRMQFKTAPRKG